MSRAAQWTAAWVGAAGLGIANGLARDLLYKDRVGDLAAHQSSTGTLIAALAGYSHALERRWPIPTTRSAWTIGGIWLSLTVVFEFVFGHYVAGESWTSLVRNYDARKGRIWGLVPISMAIFPAAVRALHAKRRKGESTCSRTSSCPPTTSPTRSASWSPRTPSPRGRRSWRST